MLAIRRTRSWRVEQPMPLDAPRSGAGLGSLIAAAIAIAMFYFFFV